MCRLWVRVLTISSLKNIFLSRLGRGEGEVSLGGLFFFFSFFDFFVFFVLFFVPTQTSACVGVWLFHTCRRSVLTLPVSWVHLLWPS